MDGLAAGIATAVRDLGFLLYGGPIAAFAVLVALADRVGRGRPEAVVRTYQAWGPGLGLALGAAILGALWLHRLHVGAFRWGWATPEERRELAAWLAFAALWVSNVRLEIWTLEPVRRADRDGARVDREAYARALRGLRLHLAVQAGLVALVVVLHALARPG